jgi:hypothetical protein
MDRKLQHSAAVTDRLIMLEMPPVSLEDKAFLGGLE